MNKYNILKNSKRVHHSFKVGDKLILTNIYALKYKYKYNGPYEIMQCWTNITFTLQGGAIKIKHDLCCIKPYTSDTNVNDIISEN